MALESSGSKGLSRRLKSAILGITAFGIGGPMLYQINRDQDQRAAREGVKAELSGVRSKIGENGVSPEEKPFLDDINFLEKIMVGETSPEKIAEIEQQIKVLKQRLADSSTVTITSSTP